MVSKRLVKLEIAFKQNKNLLFLIIFWFAFNFWVLLFTTGNLLYSLAVLVYVEHLENPFGNFYSTYSEFIVFGLLVGLVTVDLFRNYDPSQTSEGIARRLKNHSIIIGYNHVGVRLARYLDEKRMPCIVASGDKELLSDLYEEEKAAVLYDPLDDDFFTKIKLAKARFLFLLDNDIVFNLKMVVAAKKLGVKARIVVRCFDDDMAKVFESYGTTVISTTAATARRVINEHLDDNIKHVHVLGFNRFSERIAKLAVQKEMRCTIVEHEAGAIHEMQAFHDSLQERERQYIQVVEGNVNDDHFLKATGVYDSTVVLIAIEMDNQVIVLARKVKEMNPGARVIVRTFSDEIESVLENLGCTAISTSRYALERVLVPIIEEKNE